MYSDKALRKALKSQTDYLSYGFEDRVMNQIMVKAEKRNRHFDLLNMVMTALVSLGLLVGTFFILKRYFSFNLFDLFTGIHIRIEYNPLYIYCFYLAFLILLLLGLDHLFRNLFKK